MSQVKQETDFKKRSRSRSPVSRHERSRSRSPTGDPIPSYYEHQVKLKNEELIQLLADQKAKFEIAMRAEQATGKFVVVTSSIKDVPRTAVVEDVIRRNRMQTFTFVEVHVLIVPTGTIRLTEIRGHSAETVALSSADYYVLATQYLHEGAKCYVHNTVPASLKYLDCVLEKLTAK